MTECTACSRRRAHEAVDRDPLRLRRHRRERRVLVEDRVRRLAAVVARDDAAATRVDQPLARPGKRTHQRFRRATMPGLRCVDHRVRRACLARQQAGIVERPDHRRDAPRPQGLALFPIPRQPVHVMPGGDEQRRHAAADIAGRAGDEDAHQVQPPSTTNSPAVTSRLSSAASQSTMRAMSGG